MPYQRQRRAVGRRRDGRAVRCPAGRLPSSVSTRRPTARSATSPANGRFPDGGVLAKTVSFDLEPQATALAGGGWKRKFSISTSIRGRPTTTSGTKSRPTRCWRMMSAATAFSVAMTCSKRGIIPAAPNACFVIRRASARFLASSQQNIARAVVARCAGHFRRAAEGEHRPLAQSAR